MYTPAQAQIAVTVLINSGQPERAQRVIHQADSSVRPDLHCALAASFAAKEQYDKALREYQAALKLDPSNEKATAGSVELYAVLAVGYIQDKDWQQALNCVKKALELSPDDPELKNLASNIEVSSALEGGSADDTGRLIEAIEKIYQANPQRLEMAHKLAMLYHQQAIALEENPNNSDSVQEAWERAIAYWSIVAGGDGYWDQWFKDREGVYNQPIPPEKREELRKSKIKERVRQIHQDYIREYTATNRKEHADRHRMLMSRWSLEMAATDAFRQLLDSLKGRGQEPPLPVACGPIAWKLFYVRDLVEEAAQKVKKWDPGNQAAQLVLESLTPVGIARYMHKDGLLKEAVDMLQKHLGRSSSDRPGRELLVEMLDDLGKTLVDSDIEQAIETWKKAKSYGGNAQQIDEKIAQAVFDRASRLAEQGDSNGALSLLKIGIRSVSSGATLLCDLYGKIACRPAIQIVNTAIDQYGNGGGFDDTIRDLDRGMKMLEEAQRAAPEVPTIQQNMNDLRSVREKVCKNEAHNLNQRAVELANAASQAAQFGQIYTAKQNVNESLKYLEKARALDPSDPTIRENYNQVLSLKVLLQNR